MLAGLRRWRERPRPRSGSRLHQPDAFAPDERQRAVDLPAGDGPSTACSGAGETRCADDVVAVDAVHRALLPFSSCCGVAPSATYSWTFPCASVYFHEGDRLPLGVGGDVIDATRGSACQWMARPLGVGRPGPPTYICRIVAVSVFVSSSAYSRMTRMTSPKLWPDQWQVPQISSAGRRSATPGSGAGSGR